MIKSISLLTRKEGLTHEDFMRHWVEAYGGRERPPAAGAPPVVPVTVT